MLTRAPLTFDLSMSAPTAGSPNSSEVLFFVSCPCIDRRLIIPHPDTSCHHLIQMTSNNTVTSNPTWGHLTPTSFHQPQSQQQQQTFVGLSPAVLTTTTPRWCFPDPNSCTSAPATPIPNADNMNCSPPCFQPQQHSSSSSPNANYFASSDSADLRSLEYTQRVLKTCGFYFGGLSWQKAAELLRETSVGTFLLRDSADPRHLYSLSVQTDRGPTSVRIHYADGQFRLDCEDRMTSAMPNFNCVLRLLEHYVSLSRTAKGDCCVWLDGTGKRDLRVRLYRPLYARVPSLQHACRVAVNAGLLGAKKQLIDYAPSSTQKNHNIDREKCVAGLKLPGAVQNYLVEYPFGL